MREKLKYIEVSYPNFSLGQIIDPDEANQNNHDIVTGINDSISSINSNEVMINELFDVKADKTLLTSTVNELAGVGRVEETVKQNATNLITHKVSADHDYKYYTKVETDLKMTTVNNSHNSLVQSLATHKVSKDHDGRYYTKEELTPWLRGGDTSIREDVFTIVESNLGDGTFTYSHNGSVTTGELGENGEQIFRLISGYYEPGNNRIEAMINDTLRRSVASGGLREVDNYTVELTSPEGSGAEITFKYYERVGMTAEYNIKLGTAKPPFNDGKNMWFEVI